MNQINENLLVLSPGDPFQEEFNDCLKIYLSGSLDISGAGIPWQQKFINGLSKMTVPHPDSPNIPDYSAFKFLVINPLSPANGTPTMNNPEFVQKFQWCLQALDTADVVFCNFLKKSTKLSAIQDFLLLASSGKIVARCPAESVFYPTVKILSQKFGIPYVGDTGSVIQVMESIFSGIQKFSELKSLGL